VAISVDYQPMSLRGTECRGNLGGVVAGALGECPLFATHRVCFVAGAPRNDGEICRDCFVEFIPSGILRSLRSLGVTGSEGLAKATGFLCDVQTGT